MKLRGPAESSPKNASAHIGSDAPPHVLGRSWTTGSSRSSAAATELRRADNSILSWTFALLQSPPGYQRPPPRQPSEDGCHSNDASLEVPSPSASPRSGQRHELNGLASATRLRLQVFSTSWRVHPPRAWRPCCMPHPLMGLHPSELCSSRAAVRRLRRPYPRDVLPPSGSCSARESAYTRRPEGRRLPRSSPGLAALQGFLPR